MNTDQFVNILTYILIFMIMLLFTLVIVYIVIKLKNNKKKEKQDTSDTMKKVDKKNFNNIIKKQSVLNFMDFDTIEDNMIIKNNGKKFVMVLKCQGINYDLMSSMEKISVEEGFLQFLNTLRYPIQLYIQTRTINMTESINNYTKKIQEIEEKLFKMRQEYKRMTESDKFTNDQLNEYFYEVTKQSNLYEYGRDILENTKKMSFNKNILVNSYYVVIPYMPEEINNNDYDKEELKNIAFSELYIRAQSIISTLYSCSVNAKIMNSYELADLLYVAYNRDESEIYGIDKAIKAEYDEMYSTAPDVLDKKMKELDRIIDEKARDLANEKILEARSEKELKVEDKENNLDDLINKLAISMIKDNKKYINNDVMQSAIKKIENQEGGKEDVEKKERAGNRRKK